MSKYLESKGIKDGKMTLDQYKVYTIEQRAIRSFGFLSGKKDFIDVSTLKLDRRMTGGQDPETLIAAMKACDR
jgi:hypothetical protein